MTGLLERTVAAIAPLDGAALTAARRHQDDLTKPPGSLGRLEDLAVQLAAIRGRDGVPLGPAGILVCAADHGVVEDGVSAFPSEVTPQMVANFLAGGAAICVLARETGARLRVLDAGVAAELPAHPDLIDAKVRLGSANIARGPAMTLDQARRAVEAGIAAARRFADEGCEALVVGDMGIGNTTPASALVAAVTGLAASDVCGRGTGVDDAGLARKVTAVAAAVARAALPDGADGLSLVAELGGLEIAAIAGAVLGGAAAGMVVLLDGHPVTAGALVAQRLAPLVTERCVAGHRSAERGHAAALARLGLVPLLDLDLRLGEGTGAALALQLVRAAARLSAEMATFSSAGVSGALDDAGPDPGAYAEPA